MTLAVDWDVKHQTNPKPQNRVNADETAPLETDLSGFTLLYILGPSDKCADLNIYLLIISQGHNLYKLQYISLEEVKIVSFQQ